MATNPATMMKLMAACRPAVEEFAKTIIDEANEDIDRRLIALRDTIIQAWGTYGDGDTKGNRLEYVEYVLETMIEGRRTELPFAEWYQQQLDAE